MSILIGIIAVVANGVAAGKEASNTAESQSTSIGKKCTLPDSVTGYNLENCNTSAGPIAEEACVVSCQEGFVFEDMQQPMCSGLSCKLVNISQQNGIWLLSRGYSGYGNAESARISLWGPGVVKFLALSTEVAYDFLTLQGTHFSGSALPPDLALPDGRHTIEWYSDDNAAGIGWTISFSPETRRHGSCATVPGSLGILALPGPCAMACSLPQQLPFGHNVSGCNTNAGPLPSSACRVVCIPGFFFADSGPAVRNGECSTPQGEFSLPGPCVEAVCVLPSQRAGYNISACDASVSALREDACDIGCLPGYRFQDERPPWCRGLSCAMIRITRGEQSWTVSRGILQYSDGEVAQVYVSGPGILEFTFFSTEEHHDLVSIDGISYSGSTAPPVMTLSAAMHTVSWESDGSVAANGWTFRFQPEATRVAACLPGGVFSLPGPCVKACKLPPGTYGFNTTDCDSSLQSLPDGACRLTCASGYVMHNSSITEFYPKCTSSGIFELPGKCIQLKFGQGTPGCKLPSSWFGYNVSGCDTSAGLLSEDACLIECASGFAFLDEGPSARQGECPAHEGTFSLPGVCVTIVRSGEGDEVEALRTVLQNLHLLPSGVEPCSWRGVHCPPGAAHYLLRISGERLGGKLSRVVGKLHGMRELRVSGHSLTGSLPTELGDLTHLEKLELDHNALTGTIPTEIAGLSHLRTLSLSYCRLTGSLPPQLGFLWRLQSLELQGNSLQGTLPESFGGLQALHLLRLQSNRLQSRIPSQIGSLTHLTLLDLGENQFTGSLPGSLRDLSALQVLRLASNILEGTLPDLSSLPRLHTIEVGDNGFTGLAWDTHDAADRRLASLNVSRNRLNGTLGFPWASLPNLELLDISWNGYLAWPMNSRSRRLRTCEAEVWSAPPQFDRLRRLDVSGNSWYTDDSQASSPVDISALSLLQSLAPLPGLVELRASSCNLQGPVTLDFATDVDYSEPQEECSSLPFQAGSGFASLAFLDLSENNITAVKGSPSTLLATASFRANALTELDSTWWRAPETGRLQSLDLRGNTALHAAVEFAQTCAIEGNASLLVDPCGFTSMIQEELGYECSKICSASRLLLEASVNYSAICRCLPGWEGRGRECRKCPADSYTVRSSHSNGFHSQCVPCPEHSTTQGLDGRSSAEACQCKQGFYKELLVAGNLSCRPCPSFATTATAGAISIEECICDSEVFRAVKSYGVLCGCGDNYFMNRKKSRCQKCSEGEDCLWRGNVTRSIRVPRVKPGFWSSYRDEVLDKYIATFQRTGCPNPAPDTTWWRKASDQSVWEGMHTICTLTQTGEANQRQMIQCCGATWPCHPKCEQQTKWETEAIAFEGHSIYRCFSRRSCLGDGSCAAYRHGTACAECTDGTYGGLDGPCVPCEDVLTDSRTYIALLGLLSILVLLILPRMTIFKSSAAFVQGQAQAFRKMRAGIMVFLQHVQLLCLASAFHVSWPDSMLWIWNSLHMLSFGADLPFACILFFARESMAMIGFCCKLMMPIVILLFSGLPVVFLHAFGSARILMPDRNGCASGITAADESRAEEVSQDPLASQAGVDVAAGDNAAGEDRDATSLVGVSKCAALDLAEDDRGHVLQSTAIVAAADDESAETASSSALVQDVIGRSSGNVAGRAMAHVLQFNYLLWSACFASIVQNSLALFACRKSPNRKLMSVVLPHIECFSERWWHLFPGASMATLVYVVAYVAWTIWLLRWQDVALRLAGFRAAHLQWPLYMAARDIAINIIWVAFSDNGTAQILLAIGVMAAYGCATAYHHPFVDNDVNLLELVSVACVLGVLIATAGLGFQRSAGHPSLEDVLEGGTDADAYSSRAAVLVLLQVLAILLPFLILMYLCLQAMPCVNHYWPLCCHAPHQLPTGRRLHYIRKHAGDINSFRRLVESMDDYEWSRFQSSLPPAAGLNRERGIVLQSSAWFSGLTGVLPTRNFPTQCSDKDEDGDSTDLHDLFAATSEDAATDDDCSQNVDRRQHDSWGQELQAHAGESLARTASESSPRPEASAMPTWEVLSVDDVTLSLSEFVWTAPDDEMNSTAMSHYRSAPRQTVSASSRPASCKLQPTIAGATERSETS